MIRVAAAQRFVDNGHVAAIQVVALRRSVKLPPKLRIPHAKLVHTERRCTRDASPHGWHRLTRMHPAPSARLAPHARAEALLLSWVCAPSTVTSEALVAAQPVLPHVHRLGVINVADQERLPRADRAHRTKYKRPLLVGASVVDVDVRNA